MTPRTRAALDAAVAKGVTIVLASGRPTAGVVPLAKDLGLDKKGGCILAYNGSAVAFELQNGGDPLPEAAGPGHGAEAVAFAAEQDVPFFLQ